MEKDFSHARNDKIILYRNTHRDRVWPEIFVFIRGANGCATRTLRNLRASVV